MPDRTPGRTPEETDPIMSYSDIVTVFQVAPECSDLAMKWLARLELEAAGARLLSAAKARKAVAK